MSGNSAIQGSMSKNAAKYALSPLTQASQRYGWPRGLSTAAGATDLKPPPRLRRARSRGPTSNSDPGNPGPFYAWPLVAEIPTGVRCNGPGIRKACRLPFEDFIILTDFSRCQGHLIGRVSRRSKQPHLSG